MKNDKLRKICAVAPTLTLGMSAFVGRGNSDSVDSGRKLIYNLGEDPETVDPTLNTSSGAESIIENALEGLMRLDESEKAVPGVAEKVDVSDNQLVYTFTLRKDAKWTDGEPVTAKDLEYSWIRVLTKETAFEYACFLYTSLSPRDDLR